VDTYQLKVSTDERVVRVRPAPEGGDGTLETTSVRAGAAGERVRASRAVILATGYYDYPNRLNVPGEELPHVSHYYREAHPLHGKRVVVVGGANSAAESALELFRAGASVTLVHRREAMSASVKYWVLPDIENRIKEGSISARFGARVLEITPSVVRTERAAAGGYEDLPADAVFLLTGYHADREFLQRCGVQIEPVTCMPRHDAETLETNVSNLFLAGGVMAGVDAAPIFIENGRLHGERVVATIAKRLGRE
jgi:thioredoxin reductase (NADPH)